MMRPTPELIYEYSVSRERALAECAQRINEARIAIPRLAQIAEERRSIAYELGRELMQSGNDREVKARAEARINALNAEEALLLKQHGLKEDYLKPHFACEICCDTGYVGTVERKLCSCMKKRLLAEKYASSSINSTETFAAFDEGIFKDARQRKLTLKAKELCMDYAERFPQQQPRDLLLMGGTGLGKSFLLNAIAYEVSSKGHDVYKTSAYNLVNSVLEGIRGKSAGPDFISPELLLIDDLGTEPILNSITRETMFSILNERQSAQRATAWATNRSFGDIQDTYGDRFFSRLVAPRTTAVLALEGKDLRLG